MTDKNKIRAEIVKLKSLYDKESDRAIRYEHPDVVYQSVLAKYCLCKYLLEFIDSLSDEPISEDLEDFAKEYSFNIPSDVFHDLPEEKQALWKREIENAIVVGANWHLNKMMKDAVEAEVGQAKYLIIPTLSYTLDNMGLSSGDKVKLIIVKEEQQ